MILKRLLIAASAVLFGVLASLLLTGDAGYLMYSTLGGWGGILVGLSFLVGKPKAAEPPQVWPQKQKLYIEPMLHDMLSDDELAVIKARFTEAAKHKTAIVLAETWDARVRLIEQATLNGTISTKTATERYQAMITEWYKAVSPEHQVQALADKYGLPAETMVQKQNLPMIAGPLVTAGYLRNDGDIAVRQPDSDNEVDDDVPTVEESLDGYVPEGQADLALDLKAYLHRQVLDARATAWQAGRKREWHVSPAWLAEVEKLRDKAGEPLYRPVKRVHKTSDGTLHGYRVVVGDQFGTPELTAI